MLRKLIYLCVVTASVPIIVLLALVSETVTTEAQFFENVENGNDATFPSTLDI
jgi:hypothetical protein